MEFDPNNPIVKLCLQGMAMEDNGKQEEAGIIFQRAWDEAGNDFEKFLAAFYLSRHQKNIPQQLEWLKTALALALKINDDAVKDALPSLYDAIAKCYAKLGAMDLAKENQGLAVTSISQPADKGPFFHGTKAALHTGDYLHPGSVSNYDPGITMNHIYFTALVNGAGLAAALAKGDGQEHVYIVEPTGPFENDPNVTNKKFPGNPTRSYRSTVPLKIIGKVNDWAKLTPEDIKKWKEKLANNNGKIIN